MVIKFNNRINCIFLSVLFVLHFVAFLNSCFTEVSSFASLPFLFYVYHFLILGWYIVIFLQLECIQKNSIMRHRFFQLLLFIIGPIIILNILKMGKYTYLIDIQLGYPSSLIKERIFSFIIEIIFFWVYYILSFLNRNNSEAYSKYIVVTSLFLFSITVDKFVYTHILGSTQSAEIANALAFFFIFIFWIVEFNNNKKIEIKSPFLISLIIIILYNILSIYYFQLNSYELITKVVINHVFDYINVY